MKKYLLVFLVLATTHFVSASLNGLKDRISAIIGRNDVSVALITANGDSLNIRGEERRELASVMKFFQAAALSRKLDYEEMLSDTVTVTADDLHKNTWSPLRASATAVPFDLNPVTLLDYSLMMSDNNAADILFKNYLSPEAVDSIVRADYHIRDFIIKHTEDEMHQDVSISGINSASANASVRLIYNFFTSDTTASATVIKAIMSRENPFGSQRIPAGISKNAAKVFHKTGTGFTKPDGTISAVNDLAFVSYPRPGGYSCYSLGVFVKDFHGTQPEAEQLIADISNAVWSAIIVDEFIAQNNSTNNIPIKHTPKVEPVEDNSWQGAVFDAVVGSILERIIEKY